MRLRFCLVCGTEFNEKDFDWLEADEPAKCRNCGADTEPLETLSLAVRRKIEKAYAIDTASVVPTQERFL